MVYKHRYFVDADMANSFHQFLLGPYTSSRLAITSPWGVYEPKFLPEGVGPASLVLQERVRILFSDFQEWMVVIFDNLLIMADTLEELFERWKLVLDRCIERHVMLKITKCYFGVTTVNFFGYEVTHGKYTLSQERRESIRSIPMPKNTTQMQSLLGSAMYFKTHIPMYSDLTAPLNDLVKKDFNWNKSTWTRDYEADLEALKDAIMNASTLYFPDYSLDWTLRTDASTVACGGTLLQECIDPSTGE
jgi:hypothetical protein